MAALHFVGGRLAVGNLFRNQRVWLPSTNLISTGTRYLSIAKK